MNLILTFASYGVGYYFVNWFYPKLPLWSRQNTAIQVLVGVFNLALAFFSPSLMPGFQVVDWQSSIVNILLVVSIYIWMKLVWQSSADEGNKKPAIGVRIIWWLWLLTILKLILDQILN